MHFEGYSIWHFDLQHDMCLDNTQALFNRFLSSKHDKEKEERGGVIRRPFLATECRDLNEADKWRQQILREVCVIDIIHDSLFVRHCDEKNINCVADAHVIPFHEKVALKPR